MNTYELDESYELMLKCIPDQLQSKDKIYLNTLKNIMGHFQRLLK